MPQPSLQIYDSIPNGSGFIGDLTRHLRASWGRSIAANGGYWLGTAEYQRDRRQNLRAWRDEMRQMFLNGLFRELSEVDGGLITWQGTLVEMELTLDGLTSVRSLAPVANRIKSIYSRIGDNVLTNGSGESGAWAAYNGATVTQTQEWVNHGSYAIKIVVADGAQRGAVIQTGLAVTAGNAYQARLSVNVVSGSWQMAAVRGDNGDEIAATVSLGTPGDDVLELQVPASNTYTGAVTLRLTTNPDQLGAGTIYADAGVFQDAPQRAETNWVEDPAAQRRYGIIETQLLNAGLSDATANAQVATLLSDHAWPRTEPPAEVVSDPAAADTGDKLTLTVAGYIHTARYRFLETSHETDTATAQVQRALALCQFIVPGAIDTNSLDFQIDLQAPQRAWDVLRDVVEAGSASGQPWSGGVYANRRYHYRAVPQAISYRYRGRKLYNAAGGRAEPHLVRPGTYVYLDDLPTGPGSGNAAAKNDPRWMYIQKVETQPGGKIILSGETSE